MRQTVRRSAGAIAAVAVVTGGVITVSTLLGGGTPAATSSRAGPPGAAVSTDGGPPEQVEPTPTPAAASTASGLSSVTKILLIVEENHTAAQMRRGMPYLASLADKYGYATNARGVARPSLPNYLAMAGGSTFGVANSKGPSEVGQRGRSVFGQALANGRRAHVYADGMDGTCRTTNRESTLYAVRHTGWPYFLDERRQCRAHMTGPAPLRTAIDSGNLPHIGWFIPSNRHNGHYPSTLADADAYLKPWMQRVLAGPDYRSGRLAVVVTFDEGDRESNNIPLVVIHPSLSKKVVTTSLNQYGMSRWLSRIAGGPPLGRAADAIDTGRAFGL